MVSNTRARPSRRQVRRALRTAAEIAADTSAPTYTRAKSAALIIRADADDEDADPKGNPEDGPRAVVVLPANGREGVSLRGDGPRYGYQPDQSVMIYRSPSELAEIERGLAGEQLALPAPDKPAAKTPAERQAAYRARKHEAAAAIA